jgi:hypothetical protein
MDKNIPITKEKVKEFKFSSGERTFMVTSLFDNRRTRKYKKPKGYIQPSRTKSSIIHLTGRCYNPYI